MKVLNLCCASGHGFEGWFASEADFQAQSASGLVVCPVCGEVQIAKLPSAPRLNLSGASAPASAPAEAAAASTSAVAAAPELPPALREMRAMWDAAVRHVVANTEDVGERFAEEARRIHYGEAANRGIRGQASSAEREALADEGIEVMSLPIPHPPTGRLQ